MALSWSPHLCEGFGNEFIDDAMAASRAIVCCAGGVATPGEDLIHSKGLFRDHRILKFLSMAFNGYRNLFAAATISSTDMTMPPM